MRLLSLRSLPWRQLLALFAALLVCTALWADARQSALADHVIRLHVLAASDQAEDQARKLRVRDAVLARARPLLAGCRSAAEAEAALSAHREDLVRAAEETLRELGRGDPVSVSLEDVWFPTRVYAAAALPAGTYRALRVVIGPGAGHNWWCVVFPSLCLPAVDASSLEAAGLPAGDVALLTEDASTVRFRFRTLEWWQTLKHRAEALRQEGE